MSAVWQILVLVLVLVAVVHTVILIAVMRQLGGILLQMTPARPGEVEEGPARGTVVEIPGVPGDTPAIVVFVSPTCEVCKPLLPAVPTIDRHYPDVALVTAISGGSRADREAYAARVGPTARPDLHKLYDAWGIPGTPFAVGVDRDRRVRIAGVVNNLDQLEGLVESLILAPPLADEAIIDDPLLVADPAPELGMVTVDSVGEEVSNDRH